MLMNCVRLEFICNHLCSQGHEIHHNVTAGIILSDHSLVLQGVTRHTAGDYTCLAANTEGKGTSNPVTLRVMCEYSVATYLSHFFQTLFMLLDHNFKLYRCYGNMLMFRYYLLTYSMEPSPS
jgi:hypothetical protein